MIIGIITIQKISPVDYAIRSSLLIDLLDFSLVSWGPEWNYSKLVNLEKKSHC